MKDIRTEIVAIEVGLKSRTPAIAERGFDTAAVDAGIVGDHRRKDGLGLLFGRVRFPLRGAILSDGYAEGKTAVGGRLLMSCLAQIEDPRRAGYARRHDLQEVWATPSARCCTT